MKVTLIVQPDIYAKPGEPVLVCSFSDYAKLVQHLHDKFDVVQRQLAWQFYTVKPGQLVLTDEEIEKIKSLGSRGS